MSAKSGQVSCKHLFRLAILGLGVAAVSACATGRSVRGYVFDPQLADAIQPGVDNRRSVNSTLGTPTLSATFSDDVWYYVSTTVQIRPVFWPEPQEHRVLAISFNERGVVSNVENYDLADMRTINPVGDKTPTRGRELGFFQQIFQNVGRFAGAQPGGGPGPTGGGPGPNGS
ncbi:outer membrane protein assembly factor BamE [Eilatimonas milleporae]|uniref:Beta-barrel assembly machine subunit BamE n=1 Tax=Eilatimonas milleporae TaxID=911205 RepID=A0A3M0CPT9_9PROT|nr:outer membrane protein assembly factor BamE [Eilatimonas milleporae]RMB08879.1 Beta-barrel assembly machine subunit BamE [Eilatimonas milleporae]